MRTATVLRAERRGILLEETPGAGRLLGRPRRGLRPGDLVEIRSLEAGQSLAWFLLPGLLGSLGFLCGSFFCRAVGAPLTGRSPGLLLSYLLSGAGFGAGLLLLARIAGRALAERYEVTVVRILQDSKATAYRQDGEKQKQDSENFRK